MAGWGPIEVQGTYHARNGVHRKPSDDNGFGCGVPRARREERPMRETGARGKGDNRRPMHGAPSARLRYCFVTLKSYSSLIVSATLSTTGTFGWSRLMSLKVNAVVALPTKSWPS